MNGFQTDQCFVSASPKSLVNDELVDRPLTARLLRDSSRIDVDSLMNEFRSELGPLKWEKYRDSLTHFLMGKLSRPELVKCLKENLGLGGHAMRNHNTLVLSLLANACREAPPGTESSLAEWKATTRGGKSRHSQMDSANDRMHKEILSLPVRERRRIKNITKESMAALKNPIIPPQLPVLVATRQAMLPHIPYFQDSPKDHRNSSPSISRSPSMMMGSGNEAASGNMNNSVRKNKENEVTQPVSGSSLLTDPLLGLHPGRTSGPLTWTQDIIQGLDIPLLSESHEIPDDSALSTRMLGIALENGVLGGVGAGTSDIMLIGLETYLRGIVDKLLALKHRHITSYDPLTSSDLRLLAEMEPSEMGDVTAPLYRVNTTFLKDEETLLTDQDHNPEPESEPELEVEPQPEPEPESEPGAEPESESKLIPRKRKASQLSPRTPLNLISIQNDGKGKTNPEKASVLREHQKGIELLNNLLN